jgi:formyltetrahydrofolate deformylase
VSKNEALCIIGNAWADRAQILTINRASAASHRLTGRVLWGDVAVKPALAFTGLTMTKYALTVTCQSTRGIVAAIANYLADGGCNITDSAQFDDKETGNFFMRISFESDAAVVLEEMRASFAKTAEPFGMSYEFHDETVKMKVIIMVSRFGHCLNDLMYRSRIGALPIDIVGVISNHMDYQKVVVNNDIPFHCIKVTPANKPEAEARIMAVVEEAGAELIVLARYMQILSDEMCQKMSGRIINIHHSFLPSFKGANPYKQAFQRGVKLIGATSHYVTADLDEGPIIEQDIVRVTHAQSSNDYVALGRDVESQVLARAIHAHIHRRVFLNGNKTVVFPASPGSYASERMG